MVFSSLVFLSRFLPAFFTIYMLSPKKHRNLVLFLGSLFFYAWGEPVCILLMLFSSVLDYGNGLLIGHAKERGNKRLARVVLFESAAVNLSLLGIFKYAEILPLPIGISFYTFQTMSYTIDVYREEVKPQRNFITFGSYVAMFPQLIAGPIVKYRDVAKELENRSVDWADMEEGIGRFCIGLGKKVLLANQIGLLWENVQRLSSDQMSTVLAWLGSLSYALQLYYDFSGYSDMAIGLARMMGFHLKENFDHPYVSGNITEFWRRWHISLGQWFREYVYIPLGGNRRGIGIQIRNILIVWALTGIWHGKGWNYLCWGLYFGVLLIFEKWFLLKWLKRLPEIISHIYTGIAVLIGMTMFAMEDLRAGLHWIAMLFGSTGRWYSQSAGWFLSNYGILLILSCIGAVGAGRRLSRYRIVQTAALVLSLAYLVDASYNPFLYFRF
jgi:alginate O-acetyltransferase complex protein AlgI